jgi:phenylalanyl-tRNA synthetase beta chain
LQVEKEISFSLTFLDYLNSSQSSEVFIGKEKIGFLGQINPQVSKKYQINEPVFIAEISLTKIFNYLDKYPRKISYKPISNFPVSEKDLSFVFPENINYNLVLKEIKEVVGDNLQELVIFDIYQNPEMVKEEKKSVSFHLVFQSSVKTLENKEIEKIIKNISERIENLFNAKLRK